MAIKVVSLKAIADRAVQENEAKVRRMQKAFQPIPAEDQMSKEEVEKAATERVIAIMQSEIEVMRRILKIPPRKKKNIVDLHDIFIDDKRIALVMDLLKGGELFDRIVERKHYTEKDAAYHFRRIMRAIKTLHANGIIHRDLKPENFVFQSPEENSQIKITDFGLAMLEGQPDIHANAIVGSPGYIAPEVLERKEYGPECDVWSMGVILYILFVGGPPFHGRNDHEIYRSIRKGKFRYPRNCKVSSLARDLVAKMLVVDPKYRITVNGVLNHPWLIQRAAQQDVSVAITRLQQFNASRKLKAVTTALAWGARSGLRRDLYKILEGTDRAAGFSGEELVNIRDTLFELKPQRTINRQQFVNAMQDLGYGTLPLEDIYDLFDGASNDSADIVEILVGLSTAASTWNGSSQIRFCFALYDRDGTGRVTLSDMGRVFRVVASEMEMSVVNRFGAMMDAWRPNQAVTYDELENQLRQSAGGELQEQLETRTLGQMADVSNSAPAPQINAGDAREIDDEEERVLAAKYKHDDDDGTTDNEDDEDDGDRGDSYHLTHIQQGHHERHRRSTRHTRSDSSDDDDDGGDLVGFEELDGEDDDSYEVASDDDVLNRPNPSRVAKRDIAQHRGSYSRHRQSTRSSLDEESEGAGTRASLSSRLMRRLSSASGRKHT